MPADDDENEEGKEGENARESEDHSFALKELMNLQYELLLRQEENHRALAMRWSNDVENLKQVMSFLEGDSDQVIHEVVALLSLFVCKGDRDPAVVSILGRNGDILIQVIEEFQPKRDAESFEQLKEQMRFKIAEFKEICQDGAGDDNAY